MMEVPLFILFEVCEQTSPEKGILRMISVFQWSVIQVTGVKATLHGTMQNSATNTFNQLQGLSQSFNLR